MTTARSDTLVAIAQDWLHGVIDDTDAQARAAALDPGTWHRDSVDGDGEWYDGDARNTLAAVYALASPALPPARLDAFIDVIIGSLRQQRSDR